MKGLTAAQERKHEKLALELRQAYTALQEKAEVYNKTVVEAFQALQVIHQELLGKAAECETFLSAVREEMGVFYNERSDKWQTSETGEAFWSWKDVWEECDLDMAVTDLEVPLALEVFPEDSILFFEELPREIDDV